MCNTFLCSGSLVVQEEQMKKTEGDIYGDIAEDLDFQDSYFQVVQNPYHGGDAAIVIKNKRGGGKNVAQMK